MNHHRGEMGLARKAYRRYDRITHRSPLHLLSGSASRRSLVSQVVAIYMEQIRQTQKVLSQVFKLPIIQHRPVRERAVQVENKTKMKKADKSAQMLVIPVPTCKPSPLVHPQSTITTQRRTHLFPRGSCQSTSISFDCQPSRELISEFREPSELNETTGRIEQIHDARENEEVIQKECFVEQDERDKDCPPQTVLEQDISSTVISPILSFRYEDEIGSFSSDSEKKSCETCCLQEKRQKTVTNFLIVPLQKSDSWSHCQSSSEPESHIKK